MPCNILQDNIEQAFLKIGSTATSQSEATLENNKYHKTSNINHTLAGNKIVDHSDVDKALPAGAAPTTSSF